MSTDPRIRRAERYRRRRKMNVYNAHRSILLRAIDDLRPIEIVPIDIETFTGVDHGLGTSFNVGGTVTGRFSSKRPNFSNIPRSDPHQMAADAMGVSRQQAKQISFGMGHGMNVAALVAAMGIPKKYLLASSSLVGSSVALRLFESWQRDYQDASRSSALFYNVSLGIPFTPVGVSLSSKVPCPSIPEKSELNVADSIAVKL